MSTSEKQEIYTSPPESSHDTEYEEFLRLDAIFQGKRKSQLMWKVDLRVVTSLALCYLVGYVDRVDVGNAKLFGLEEDLNITPGQYNFALMSFFFTYAAFDIPAQLVLKRVGPKRFISFIMTSFGLITMFTGFTTNYGGIITCRVLLGVVEAGLFPGVCYILSTWYSPWELQTRVAWFYGGASASGAFGGLLAYAIANLDHVHGYRAWRWIFGIEGLFTTLFGIAAFFFVSPHPKDTKRWLDEDERQYLVLRQRYVQGSKVSQAQGFEWKYVVQGLKDWKSYAGVMMFFGTSIPVYGLSYTLPTIIKSLGYSAARAQGMTAPPYIFASIVTIGVSMLADRYKQRGLVLIAAFTVSAIGFAIVMGSVHDDSIPGVTLFGIFLTAAGLYSVTPTEMAWMAQNVPNETKRAVVLSVIPTIGQLGGICGSNIYLTREAPIYSTGFGVSLGVVIVCGIFTGTLTYITMRRINAKRDAMNQEELREKYTEQELTDLGDQSPFFRYSL